MKTAHMATVYSFFEYPVDVTPKKRLMQLNRNSEISKTTKSAAANTHQTLLFHGRVWQTQRGENSHSQQKLNVKE